MKRTKQEERQRRNESAIKQWNKQTQKNKTRLPVFKIKQVDYSQLMQVRIDHKTIVYANPGEDPAAVKERYLQRASNQKQETNNIKPSKLWSSNTQPA